MARAVLLKLKPDVSEAELEELRQLLARVGHPEHMKGNRFREPNDGIREYDDKYGDPVFYIP